jgi:hypothetical protein
LDINIVKPFQVLIRIRAWVWSNPGEFRYKTQVMKRKYVTTFRWSLAVLVAFLLSACGGSKKNMADDPEYQAMVEEVKDLDFIIENLWAIPTQYNRVDLIGNPNYIIFENDSVEVYLPFFGERYAGGSYDRDEGAIQYKGVPKELEIVENPEKGSVDIFFEGDKGTENLKFNITLYTNELVRTNVTSTQREQIEYEGKLVKRK